MLSIVVPLFNEGDHVDALVEATLPIARGLGQPFELILVDDASTDGTREKAARRSEPEVRVVSLERNQGQFEAVKRGFRESAGDLVVTLDGDMQDPPAVIAQLVERARGLASVPIAVYAVKSSRSESATFRAAQWLFHGLQSSLARTPMPFGASSYCLLSGDLARRVGAMPLRSGNVAAVVAALGVRGEAVEYAKQGRSDGGSHLGLSGHVREAVASLVLSGAMQRLLIGVGVVAVAGTVVWIAFGRPGPGLALGATAVVCFGSALALDRWVRLQIGFEPGRGGDGVDTATA